MRRLEIEPVEINPDRDQAHQYMHATGHRDRGSHQQATAATTAASQAAQLSTVLAVDLYSGQVARKPADRRQQQAPPRSPRPQNDGTPTHRVGDFARRSITALTTAIAAAAITLTHKNSNGSPRPRVAVNRFACSTHQMLTATLASTAAIHIEPRPPSYQAIQTFRAADRRQHSDRPPGRRRIAVERPQCQGNRRDTKHPRRNATTR